MAFTRRAVTVAPGVRRPFYPAEWRDALVLLRAGTIELESRGGTSARLTAGDLFWLDGVALQALHNPGAEEAVLVAVARYTSTVCSRSSVTARSSKVRVRSSGVYRLAFASR